jgi:phosphopantetheinyl transferase (holo-ACP synthase)
VSLTGNDVVDLDDPLIAGAHLRERFVARVCAPVERERLARSPSPKALLWALFAAKEAAYKAVCKLGPAPVFAHRRFVVAEDFSRVQWGELTLKLRVEQTAAWVHALAWLGERAPSARVAALPAGVAPGAGARRLLLAALGGEEGLEVVRDPLPGSWTGRGPPRVERDGEPLPVDVSLSHDGRWVACAHDSPVAA